MKKLQVAIILFSLAVLLPGLFTPALGKSQSRLSNPGDLFEASGEWVASPFGPVGKRLLEPDQSPTDLAVAKSDNPDPVLVGNNLTYVITITNNGPEPAETVRITDTLPSSVNLVSATASSPGSCSQAEPAEPVVCQYDTLASGSSAQVTIVVKPGAAGTITNTVVASAANPDPDTANNTAQQSTSVIPAANLSVTKSDSADPVIAGTSLTYSLVVSNAGPSQADSVVLTDTLPSGVSYTSAAGPGWTCSFLPPDKVRCTLPSLAASSNSTVTLNVSVNPATTEPLSNTVVVASSTADPQPGNNTATELTTVNAVADLSLVKGGGATATAGTSLVYTLEVTNGGPSAASSVLVTDTLPSGLSYAGYSGSGWTCGASGQVVSCTRGSLGLGTAPVINLTVGVAPGVRGVVQNRSRVSAATVDSNAGNNVSNVNTTVSGVADLELGKGVTNETPNVGSSITFQVTVENKGPSQATGVVVKDLLASGYSLTGVTASQGSYNAVSGEWSVGSLAPNGTANLQLTVTVLASGVYDNYAEVIASGESDPDSTKNNGSTNEDDDAQVSVTPVPVADLSLAKGGGATATAGTSLVYTLEVTNGGPSAASSVLVTDTLPSGLSYAGYSGSGWTCGAVGQVVSCTRGSLGVGTAPVINLTVGVAPGVRGVVQNRSRVSAATVDTQPGNNVSNVNTTVSGVADLELGKGVTNATPNVGSSITFQVTVENKGPSQATGVVVKDLLASGYSLTGVTASQGSYNAVNGEWSVGSLAPSGTASLQLTVTVLASGVYDNYAEVIASGESDPDSTKNNGSTNEDDDAQVSVTPVPVADLSLAKGGGATATAGTSLVYTLEVTNGGPSAASSVLVTDTLPSGLSYAGYSGSGWTCGASGQVVSCTRGSLGLGTAPVINLTVGVAPGVRGVVQNRSRVSAATVDTQPGNNVSNVNTTVSGVADLELGKGVTNATPNVGSSITFQVTVENKGPSQATGVVVKDLLASGYSLTGVTASQGSYNAVSGEWSVGSLAPNGTASLQLTVDVLASGVYDNYAEVIASGESDPDSTKNNGSTNEDDDAQVSVTPVPVANLSVTSAGTPAPVKAGTDLTYSLVVTNGGPSEAQSVVLTDTVPAGTTYKSAGGTGWTCNPPVSGKVICTRTSLGVTSAAVTLVVTVNAGTTGTVSNQVEVRSATSDPNLANNSATEVTSVTTEANLSVTSAGTPAPVKAGTDLTYSLVVTNGGPSEAQSVVLTDTVPAGTTYKSASGTGWTCNPPVSGKVICTRTSLGVTSAAVTLVVTVNAGTTGTVSNQVEVRSATSDPNLANNSATEVTSVTTEANLSVTSAGTPAPVKAGTDLTYSLVVTNGGPSEAQSVVLTDTVPAGTTYKSASGTGWTCNPPVSGKVICTRTSLGVTSATVTLVVTVNAGTTGTVSNQVEVRSATSDPNLTNNSATEVTSVTTEANLSVTSAGTPAPVKAGTDLTYSLVVTNGGPSEAQSVVLTDTVPAGTTYKSAGGTGWTCNPPVSGKVICTRTSLGVTSAAVTLVVTVNAGTTGTVSNQVEVRSATSDPNLTNNSATEVTSVTTEANLSVTKSDSPDPVYAGNDLTYSLVVTNGGPSDALNVVLTDTLPAGVTIKSVTAAGWACTQPAGKVRCTIASLSPASSSLTLVVTVQPATRGSLTNQVTVVSTTPDPNLSNNTTSTATTVSALADLELVKTAATTTPYVGSNAVFTVTVTNKGPSQANGIEVVDLLPSGYNTGLLSHVASQGTYNKTTGLWSVGILNPNAVATLRITVPVKASGSYNNYAQVTAVVEPDPDSVKNNNSTNEDDDDTLVVTPIPVADLVIVQSDNPDPATAGTDLTYSLVVSNAGPSTAQSLVVTDTLPAGVTFKSASGVNWTCTVPQASKVRCTRESMNASTNSTITVVVTVNSSTLGVLTNNVVVTSSTVDLSPTTNTNDESTNVQTRADLVAAMTDTPDPVSAGTNLTYNLTLSNAGPSDALNVVVTDTLPSGVVYQSYSGSGWSCQLLSGKLVCSRSLLAAGANAPLSIVVKVNTNITGSISNSATIASQTTEVSSSNNTATSGTTVNSVVDLLIGGIDSVDPVIAGDVIAYTIWITNTGPSDAWTLVMTDTLPSGTSLITSFGTGWTCTPISVGARCERPSLAWNGNTSLNVVARVDAGRTGTLSNLFVVTARGSTDSQPANNSKTEVTNIITRANLGIVKVASSDPVIAGTNLTYTLTVSNAGLSHATSLVVTDTLPSNVNYLGYGGSAGWICSLNVNRLHCTLASLNANAESKIVINTIVQSGASGSLTNQAEVRSATVDPNLSNNSVSIATSIIRRADLAVEKIDTPDPVAEGQVLTYTLTVTNLGPSNATSVSLTENIPSEVQFQSATVVQGSATCSGTGPVTCSLGTMVSGSVVKINVRTQAKPVNNVPKTATNTVSVSSSITDPVTGNNSKTQTTGILPAADLKLSMVSSSSVVEAGSLLTYTLTVTNTGPSTATNLVVTDTLPAGMTYVSSSIPPVIPSGSGGSGQQSNLVVWQLGNLNPGSVSQFTLVVRVVSPTQPLLNQAQASADQWDLVTTDSQDDVVIQAVDSVPPTISWMPPWQQGHIYYVSNEMVRLYVTASDNVEVEKVRFFRWDALINKYVDIGYDYNPAPCEGNPGQMCYEFTFDARILNPKYNEIRVRAFDTSRNFYPPMDSPVPVMLWIYRIVSEVYLPVLLR